MTILAATVLMFYCRVDIERTLIVCPDIDQGRQILVATKRFQGQDRVKSKQQEMRRGVQFSTRTYVIISPAPSLPPQAST